MEAIPSLRCLRYMRQVLRPSYAPLSSARQWHPLIRIARKHLHTTRPLLAIKSHKLADIGEGVKEVQIIQWFVEEGAKIEEWGAICEVQSDKASTEITSKYTGVVKKIYYKRDEVVQVGDVMLDIEVEGEDEAEAEAEVDEDAGEREDRETTSPGPVAPPAPVEKARPVPTPEASPREATSPVGGRGSHANLATPAVRSLLKEHNLSIEDIHGTGRDGRVLKEDVFKHLEKRASIAAPAPAPVAARPDAEQIETVQKLTPIQGAMFKAMTASLSIPHFLYTDSVNITDLSSTRKQLNAKRSPDTTTPKLTYLPFIVKAVSLALTKYPLLNARLDLTSDPTRPQLQMRSNHNIGIAMDTPAGLVVPVIKSVNARSISSIAQELVRLSQLGQAGKLSSQDLSGGTITVSNIGNIGGGVLAPVIVEGQLAIMAVGQVKAVPVFGEDGQVQRAEMVNMSWSADHRVVDGATMARMASVVKGYLEHPGSMLVDMI
ncbi:hypothetical protein DV735_g4290, partial [Chaetothyriales sp. CBS 134920]